MPEEEKAAKEEPPPPPPEIVLKVYMHCEGCARKVRRCLKGFDGMDFGFDGVDFAFCLVSLFSLVVLMSFWGFQALRTLSPIAGATKWW